MICMIEIVIIMIMMLYHNGSDDKGEGNKDGDDEGNDDYNDVVS